MLLTCQMVDYLGKAQVHYDKTLLFQQTPNFSLCTFKLFTCQNKFTQNFTEYAL